MCKLRLNFFGQMLSHASLVKLAVCLLLAGAATTVWAAPPVNDDWANATDITGLTGTTNGTDIGATAQPGEPVVDGIGGGKTIWYSWTVPSINGAPPSPCTMLFNTEGSDFDTVMAVYTGTSVSNLTLIAQNDDVSFPSDLTSQVTFAAFPGVNYFIVVDGNEGDSGNVILNWNSTGNYSAGNFTFASSFGTDQNDGSPVYLVSQFDSPPNAQDYPTMTDNGMNVRVVRNTLNDGYAGMVNVSYLVSNMTWTNFFVTNFYGSNVITTNSDRTFSNVFITNVIVVSEIETYTGNQTGFGLFTNGFQIGITNINGAILSSTSILTGAALALPFPCPTNTLTNSITTNGTVISTNITKNFCFMIATNQAVPSALPNVDYVDPGGIQTATLQDYQMGANLSYTILPNMAAGQVPTDVTNIRNALVVIYLTSVALDPQESTNSLTPPTILTPTAFVEIQNANFVSQAQFEFMPAAVGVPYGMASSTPVIFPGIFETAIVTNSIANFQKSIYWIAEHQNNQPTVIAEIYVMRTGTNTSSSMTVNYTADLNPNTGASDAYNFFPTAPGSDYATPTNSNPGSREKIPHYTLADGTVSWGANDTALKPIDIIINYDPMVQFNEDIVVQLYNAQGGCIGQQGYCTLTILFNDQPAGALDVNHNPDNAPLTVPPENKYPGAGGQENTVFAAVVQPNVQTVFGGDFLAYNTKQRNHIARMNFDGSLDTNFLASPNNGANDTIDCLALQTNGQILIGGAFTVFNGTNRYHVARLNSDGSLDPTFNTGVGVNGTVWSIACQPDGKVVIGGDFTTVNGTNRNYVARLNTNGTLDLTFDPGVGPNSIVNALALQGDGGVIIGGQFTTVDGTNMSSIARLTSAGPLDTTFNPGPGADQPVYALALQENGQILLAGAFANVNNTSRNSIARLNSNGSMDLTFDPGSGADDVIYTMALQPDGNILIGGQFASYNGTRRIGVARVLNSGFLDTSFMDTAYNQFAGLINPLNNQAVNPKNILYTIAVQPDTNVIIGGHFYQVGGGGTRDTMHPRMNIARLIGGSTPGPGNVGMLYNNYTIDKEPNNQLYVSLQRINGALGTASVTLQPNPLHTGTGDAVPNVDYVQTILTPTWATTWNNTTWSVADSLEGDNFNPFTVLGGAQPLIGGASVQILDNLKSSGNLGLNLQLSQPLDTLALGGETIATGLALANSSAPMTIVDDSIPAGTLSFSVSNFFVNENATNAVISVIRTNGSVGPVSVKYQTIPGTALPGLTNDYIGTSGTLSFGSGQTNKTFTVAIVNNTVVRPDRSLTLNLYNPTGGAALGSTTNALLTIINDNFLPGMMSFIANNGTNTPNYVVHQDGGPAIISVNRLGGSLGTESIAFSTGNGTATTNDYIPTNGVLSWNSGDTTPKTFAVSLLNDGLVLTNRLTIKLALSQPVVDGVTNTNAFGQFTNATVSIINDNFFGKPTLSASSYYVNENGGGAIITVNRLGGSSQNISVQFTTADATARSGIDYLPTNGVLTFGPGVFSQSFFVPVINNTVQTNNNVFFNVTLSSPSPTSGPGGAVGLGSPSTATVTIIANQIQDQAPGGPDTTFNANAGFNANVYAIALQTNGSLVCGGDFTVANGIARNRIARLDLHGNLDVKFSSDAAGANGSVRALAIQTDGEILAGGLFTTVNGVNQNYITRLNYDGSLDSTFNPGSAGADNPIYAIAETFAGGVATTANRKIVIGGSFASVDGIPYRSLAQLNEDGSVDTTFDATPSAGINGTVYAIQVYSTNDDVNGGKILIGGDFTVVNGASVAHMARLNADGSLDTTFNNPLLTSGPNDSVRSLAIQVDGNVVIGGLFTSVNGVPLNYYARLDPFGQVDPTFNVGVGANGAVTALAIQQDLKIIVGGAFTQASGVTRSRLTRLNSDGTVDPGINFGSGANGQVDAIVIQPDSKLVIGGGFTTFDGVSKPYIARLFGGTEIGPGNVQFVSGYYQANEGATNIVITVDRVGGTAGSIAVLASTSNSTAISGVDYIGVTNLLYFGPGETFQSFTVPILNDPTNLGELFVNLSLTDTNDNPIVSDQATALLAIIGANSTVSFSAANYAVNKNTSTGVAAITINRNLSSVGTSSVVFTTTTNGTATPTLDYTPVTNILVFTNGQSSQTVFIPINNNGLTEGNLTVGLDLSNPTNTALDLSLPTVATLTIVDNSQAPGSLSFSAPSYVVSDGATNIAITVVRTNGSVGQISVNYTAGGGTATPGVDYTPVSGTLTFIDGQTSQTFNVPIIDDPNLTADVTVNLTISQPTGGASLVAPTTVPLTIQNANFDVSFAQAGYFVDEKNGSIIIGVNRTGSTNGTVFVNYATSNGTASNGVNYLSTSGTLTFLAGQTFETFIVPIVYDPQITGNLIFFVNLTTSNSSPVQLVSPATTVVTVLDDNTGFAFATPTNSITKGATNAIISVLRLGNVAGADSVSFNAGGGTAAANIEYVPTNGVLNFSSGQTTNTFSVQILNDGLIDGNQTVNLSLSAPTAGAQLLSPSNEVLTIIDTQSGFSFSSGNYSVNENGVSALITVLRTGVLTNAVSVHYATADGTGHAGGQYVATSGTLNFTNGVTSASFSVPIIDNNVTGGSDTVLLQLSKPSGTASLLSPVAATLTILNNDGSLIVPAGSALLSPTNGIINPNTNITMLFSLLNTAGSNTTVTATLLATNGITPQGGSQVQNYGTLVVGGTSVFRPFIFSVSGTNGTTTSAVLKLNYGTNVTTVSYSLTLGTATNYYTNNALITINDLAAATPYPATINVSSLVGAITKATVTVSNLGHAYISDVAMLLSGPTGTNDLLLENTGGAHVITNVTLTFDSASSSGLTSASPTTGTYRPSPLQTGIVFPTATNGTLPPLLPYGTNLNDLNGSNPNGTWSLYVADTRYLNSGTINNGWSLAISTVAVITPNVDLAVGQSASPNPVIVSNALTYTISVTNAGPSPATGVKLTDVLPAGVANVSASLSQGTYLTNNAGNIVCSLGGLATNGTATVTLTFSPTEADLGFITNLVSVTANETEDNPANNSASLVTSVIPPSAELTLTASENPNPVYIGNLLTYTIIVSNLGPATATGVIVTNTLPTGVTYVTNNAPGGFNDAAGFVTMGIGTMASGAATTLNLEVEPTVAQTFSTTFGASSPVADPFKGNRIATLKTIVLYVPLTATYSHSGLTFTWPAGGSITYTLQSTPTLNPPNWTAVGITPTLNGNAETVTVPVGGGTKFFRLIGN